MLSGIKPACDQACSWRSYVGDLEKAWKVLSSGFTIRQVWNETQTSRRFETCMLSRIPGFNVVIPNLLAGIKPACDEACFKGIVGITGRGSGKGLEYAIFRPQHKA